jgi:N-carbamoyl-L-amino-acid hydrolase
VITLEALNALPAPEFVASLGGIFEHSPWVAERAAAARPFISRLQMLDAMRAVVQEAPAADQLALIRAHPQLGARGRSRTQLTEPSAREQRRAGLDACTDAQFSQLLRFNEAYVEKFAFPFILAVRGHDPASILRAIEQRSGHAAALERRTALAQIGLIAGYRLADLVATPAGVEIIAMNARLAAINARAATAGGDAAAEPVSSLLREWMLAAGLEVHAGRGEELVGIQRSAQGAQPSEQGAQHLLIGVYYDAMAQALRVDGRLGFLIGIAVAQQLRQKGIGLPFDLAILAHPAGEWVGNIFSHADPDAIRGCAALTAADIDSLPALRAAGIADRCLAIVRQGPAGIAYRADAPLEAHTLERAARTLEDFLMQTQPAEGRQTGVTLHG